MNASDSPGSICGRMLPWGLQGGPPSEPVSDDISILPNVLTPNQAIALLSAQSQRGTGRSWRSAVPPSLPYANSANQSQFDVLLSGNSGEDASGGVLAALDRARVLGGSTARAIGAMDDEELFQLGLAHGIMLGGLPRNECVDILIQHFARFHPQLLDGPPPSSLHAIGRMCVPISDSYQHVIEERYSTAPEDIDPEAFLDTPMHASHEFTFINPVRAAAMSSPGIFDCLQFVILLVLMYFCHCRQPWWSHCTFTTAACVVLTTGFVRPHAHGALESGETSVRRGGKQCTGCSAVTEPRGAVIQVRTIRCCDLCTSCVIPCPAVSD